jgi:plastocyanin
MTTTGLRLLIFLLGLATFHACSKNESPKETVAPPAAAAPAPAPAPPPSQSSPGQGIGTITGKVVFKGTATPSKVTIGKDKEACGDSTIDPSLMVGSGGEVKNAVVSIAELKQGKTAPKDAVIDQLKCVYTPHVVAINPGGTVKIKNSDGILHNVHSFSEKNPPFNRAQPRYLKEISEKFTKAETISVRCDVHGWMSGWIVVTDSSFFDVSTAEGTFKLDGVPVGNHTLEIWHETLGKTTQPVEVKAGEVTHVTFEFQMKK